MALKVGPTGHIFAFEPARRALWLLHRIIRFNDIDNITVVPKAASDSSGKADFTEYAYDPQASIAWIPEASTIGTPDTSKRCQSYEVETVSLDDFIAATDRKIIAIKIDVEGFELHVLRGARALLERDRPVLSIDIHQRIDDLPGTTEEEARTFLSSLGYAFSTLDHVLLAECAVTSTAHAKKHPHSEL
jgi:FkbM family methyltransferase